MRGSLFLKILVLFKVILTISCGSRQAKESIIISPFEIGLNTKITNIQEKLKEQNIILVYENSYNVDDGNTKYYYFDYTDNGLNYHFDIYTKQEKLRDIKVSIFSTRLDKEKVIEIIEKKILPKFKESISKLNRYEVVSKWIDDERLNVGYYYFSVSKRI